MERKYFLKTILTTSIFLSMDGLSSMMSAFSSNNKKINNTDEIATFGAVHLNNTSLEKATNFWTKIVGMKLRDKEINRAEFGTETQTLVVVHQTAKTPHKEGYSGLYHFAIHAPNKHEFAKMLYRLLGNRYPCSPIDHTMSKSVYLNDPDGITIEFALETPERFKRIITDGGLKIEDIDGTIRSGSASLNIEEALKDLQNNDISQCIHNDSKIGHIHFYAIHVEELNAFYKKIGFQQFNYLPQFLYADVGAGGIYQHRVAMNAWHGQNKPLAPKDSAGLKHYQIIFNTKEKLEKAIKAVEQYEAKDGGYFITDPTGNLIFLKHQ